MELLGTCKICGCEMHNELEMYEKDRCMECAVAGGWIIDLDPDDGWDRD